MCNTACVKFVQHHLTKEEIQGRSVLEVGALDVNGTVRPAVEALGPAEYIGVDIETGPGVDEVCDAHELVERFGDSRFDILISTELLEHVRNWRKVISGFKQVLKPGGLLILTTRSEGHPYHGYPWDFWRYEPDDMKVLFADFDIERIDPDRLEPGVFVKARKPVDFREQDLARHNLYAVIQGHRVRAVTWLDVLKFRVTHRTRRVFARTRYLAWEALCRMAPASLKRFVKAHLRR